MRRCFVFKSVHKQLPGYSLDDDDAILFFDTVDEGYNFDLPLTHDGGVFMQYAQQVARQANTDATNATADDTNTRMLVGGDADKPFVPIDMIEPERASLRAQKRHTSTMTTQHHHVVLNLVGRRLRCINVHGAGSS